MTEYPVTIFTLTKDQPDTSHKVNDFFHILIILKLDTYNTAFKSD